jgi:CheY-like chemotaxis protein
MTRILYIEDNPQNMDLVCRILKHVGGYDVLGAVNGLTGVETAVRERPDLILMDINLPDISGLEATRRIRQQPLTRTTPIVAFTADTGEGARQMYLDAGCDGYMAKPASAATLLQVVKKYV